MKILLLFPLMFFCGACSTLYYGVLPGANYPIYDSQEPFDLRQRAFKVSVIDRRMTKNTTSCDDGEIDRNTELEGHAGVNLVQKYLERSITTSNGTISEEGQALLVEVEALSFRLVGAFLIRVEGIAQLKVNGKTYCEKIDDQDNRSKASWYSVNTRTGASRKMASMAVRLTIDNVLKDLSHEKK